MSCVLLLSAVAILIRPMKTVAKILAIMGSILFIAWLLTATIFRFDHVGKVCSGDYANSVGILI